MKNSNQKEPKPKEPPDLLKALSAKPLVKVVWDSLTPLARWDFIIWVNQTREPKTRQHRIERTCSMLTAGKRRPCCFTIVSADLYKALKANPKANAEWKKLGAVERRNFVTWIDSAKDLESGRSRAGQACQLIASGKQSPK
jgi:uncharacterized protein YdeI (YjbR/CyaY-like superfamily)